MQVSEETHIATGHVLVLSTAMTISACLRATFWPAPRVMHRLKCIITEDGIWSRGETEQMWTTTQDLPTGKKPKLCLLLFEVKICVQQTGFLSEYIGD